MPCEITVRSGKPVLAGRTVPSWDGLDLRHTCSAAAHSARFAHVDQLARWIVPLCRARVIALEELLVEKFAAAASAN